MYQTDFSPQELKARRQKICDAIGKNAVALLQGAREPKGYQPFHQYSDFYYLCGIETPRSYLLINGANGRTTAFLPHEAELEKQSDEELLCAENAKLVCETASVDQALGVEMLGQRIGSASVVYTPFEDGQSIGVNRYHCRSWAAMACGDPWDGRLTRTTHFIDLLRRRFPHLEIRNLSPLLDEHRLVKSPAEIALLRRAGELTAIAMREAIRSTRPGVMEYQLDAVMRYHYLAGGAKDRGYQAIIAGGANVWHAHYSSNDCELKSGDLVLCDCAPVYRYYTSDIGRMWPVNGKYSAAQRSLYGFVVEYHKALLQRIRPGRMLAEIHAEAAEAMKAVADRWKFASPVHEAAARAMFEFRGHLSHCVGMSVHDGGGHWARPLEPGIVFTVDPQMFIPAEKGYVRVEDTIVVTENGIENLTAKAPLELDDVETLWREKGLLQTFPTA